MAKAARKVTSASIAEAIKEIAAACAGQFSACTHKSTALIDVCLAPTSGAKVD